MKRVVVNGKSQLHADEHFRRFDVEAWIIGRLDNPPHIVDGVTTYATRKPLIAREILRRGLENIRIVEKRAETWRQVFERFYGESLITVAQQSLEEKITC